MKKQTKFAASAQHTAHSTLDYLRCKINRSASIFLQLIVFMLMVVMLNACKRDMSERVDYNATSIGIDERSKQVTIVLAKYNYITKSKNTLFKTIEQIDSDSVPIILDILLNYNATEQHENVENIDVFEFTFDYPVNAEGNSNIIVIDSLYEIIYEQLFNLVQETHELNKFLYFVSVFHDGRFEDGLKGIKVITKRGSGEVELMPRYVPSTESWRAHNGYEFNWPQHIHYGGTCNDLSENPNKIGAPKIIQNYVLYNLPHPALNIPNGYRMIYTGDNNFPLYPENTHDFNHPTFNLTDYINNEPNTFYPTKIYACATANSWYKSGLLVKAPCLSATLLNYYIDKALELAIQNKPSNDWHPVRVSVEDDPSSAMNNCRFWNPMPNPPYNTGKSIDNGVCPEGSHYLGLHYKLITIVPDNL